jgi:hypothetical protein
MKRTTINCNPDTQISGGHIYTTIRAHNFTVKEWTKLLKDFNISSKRTDYIQLQLNIATGMTSLNHYHEGPTARMILLKLHEQQAWFLTQLFENVFAQDTEEDNGIFSSADPDEDEDGNFEPMQTTSFDQDFKDHIIEVDELLTKARGL